MRKTILHIGSILLIGIFSGCSVYHPDVVSIDEGVNSPNRIKITTSDNYILELKKLVRENGQLYGITAKNSEAAKLLFDHPQIPDGRNVKIVFNENDIKAVHLKNRKISKLVNVGVPLVGAAGLIGLTNRDFKPDVGN